MNSKRKPKTKNKKKTSNARRKKKSNNKGVNMKQKKNGNKRISSVGRADPRPAQSSPSKRRLPTRPQVCARAPHMTKRQLRAQERSRARMGDPHATTAQGPEWAQGHAPPHPMLGAPAWPHDGSVSSQGNGSAATTAESMSHLSRGPRHPGPIPGGGARNPGAGRGGGGWDTARRTEEQGAGGASASRRHLRRHAGPDDVQHRGWVRRLRRGCGDGGEEPPPWRRPTGTWRQPRARPRHALVLAL